MTIKCKKYTKHKDKHKEKQTYKQSHKKIVKTFKYRNENIHKNIHGKTKKIKLYCGGFKPPRIKSYKKRSYNSGDEIVGQSQGQSRQGSSSGEKQKRSYLYHVGKAFRKFIPPELGKRNKEYKFKKALNKVSKVKLAKTGNDTNNITPPLTPPIIPNEEAENLIAQKLKGPQINNENNEGFVEGPNKQEEGPNKPEEGPNKPEEGPIKPPETTGTGTQTTGTGTTETGTEKINPDSELKNPDGTLKNKQQSSQGEALATSSASVAAASSSTSQTLHQYYQPQYIIKQKFYTNPGSSPSTQRGTQRRRQSGIGTQTETTNNRNFKRLRSSNEDYLDILSSNEPDYITLTGESTLRPNARRSGNLKRKNEGYMTVRQTTVPLYGTATRKNNNVEYAEGSDKLLEALFRKNPKPNPRRNSYIELRPDPLDTVYIESLTNNKPSYASASASASIRPNSLSKGKNTGPDYKVPIQDEETFNSLAFIPDPTNTSLSLKKRPPIPQRPQRPLIASSDEEGSNAFFRNPTVPEARTAVKESNVSRKNPTASRIVVDPLSPTLQRPETVIVTDPELKGAKASAPEGEVFNNVEFVSDPTKISLKNPTVLRTVKDPSLNTEASELGIKEVDDAFAFLVGPTNTPLKSSSLIPAPATATATATSTRVIPAQSAPQSPLLKRVPAPPPKKSSTSIDPSTAASTAASTEAVLQPVYKVTGGIINSKKNKGIYGTVKKLPPPVAPRKESYKTANRVIIPRAPIKDLFKVETTVKTLTPTIVEKLELPTITPPEIIPSKVNELRDIHKKHVATHERTLSRVGKTPQIVGDPNKFVPGRAYEKINASFNTKVKVTPVIPKNTTYSPNNN
jgi:hypothetical protein